MKQLSYIAMACALVLTGLRHHRRGSAGGLSAVSSALARPALVVSGASKVRENKVGAALDVFKGRHRVGRANSSPWPCSTASRRPH